jgi:hypothetical protein
VFVKIGTGRAKGNEGGWVEVLEEHGEDVEWKVLEVDFSEIHAEGVSGSGSGQ